MINVAYSKSVNVALLSFNAVWILSLLISALLVKLSANTLATAKCILSVSSAIVVFTDAFWAWLNTPLSPTTRDMVTPRQNQQYDNRDDERY